jgi:predicted Asp-tRNA(Asn)/Glu-tRNA(Gln) amidotransferase subunit C
MDKAIDKEIIEKEAKELLERFANCLEKVEKEHDLEFFVERDNFQRLEKIGTDPNSKFKERMLENAPKKDSDFIIAEKGNWK